MTGGFQRFGGAIRFSADGLASSSALMRIDLTSFTTGDGARDQQARGPAWLDAANAPEAVYRAASFEPAGEDYRVTAELTVRGITQPIEHLVAARTEGQRATAEGEVPLTRRAFGNGQAADPSGQPGGGRRGRGPLPVPGRAGSGRVIRNSAKSWGWPARALHWLVATLVVGLWVLGKVMTNLEDFDPQKFALYQLHKSVGITVFALGLVHLAWRLASPTPLLPAHRPEWRKFAAGVSHALLYLLLFLIPVTGFLMVSTSPLGIPTVIFGILPIPHALGPNAFLEEIFKELHQVLGYLLALLLLLHAGAALKHHFYNRDPI